MMNETGGVYANSGSQVLTRRRVLPRGPGSSWPGRGWYATTLPARRGYSGRPAGDYWKKRTRMNPLNIHALKRALRRTSAATKLVKRLLSLPKHTVRLKSRRRKVKV